MNLKQINSLWEEYKNKYDIDSDAEISAVRYDTDEYIEGCFNLLELMNGEYILHLNPRMHLYNENYCKFILFHEFTHFYDYINRPYEDKEKLIIWMNAYSEYHACRVTLARFIEMFTLSAVHIDKTQIPGPYSEISIRRLLVESIYRAKFCYDAFFFDCQLQDYANGLRQLMYLLGYISLFHNDAQMAEHTLKALGVYDENYCLLYKALKDMDYDGVIRHYKAITEKATLLYLKASFRRFYSRDILSDEEIEGITLDNYREYIERLDRRRKALDDGQEKAAFLRMPLDQMAAFLYL